MVCMAVVALFSVFIVSNTVGKTSESLGTTLTYNAQNQSYTEGADARQNLQAISERFANLTPGYILQASSTGNIEPVSPSNVSGTWSFDVASFDTASIDAFNYRESIESVTVSNTVAVSESGKTFLLSGATSVQTLPTSTPAGQVYRFQIAASVTGDITVVTSGAENVIDGTLVVAGAVVDCDSEDTLTFVADGENVGDFFELRSTGTRWLLGASGALTASKLTCTAT